MLEREVLAFISAANLIPAIMGGEKEASTDHLASKGGNTAQAATLV
jgi:hypothetical protein